MKLFTLRNYKKMDLLISISDNTRKDAQKMLDLDTPITAIPLAADNHKFYQAGEGEIRKLKEKYHIKKKYLLTVCTLEPRKNLNALLKAFEKVDARIKSSHQLVLTGMEGWRNEDFLADLKTRDYYENIVFTGYVDESALAPLYSGAELFVFPSLYEGFGLPVLEAMQCGCPVITSNVSSLPEVAGDAAVLVDPEDIESISRAIEGVLRDSDMRSDLRTKGLKRSEKFSWVQASRVLLSSLEELVESKQYE